MGRPKLPAEEKKKTIGFRLQQKYIDILLKEEQGTIQEIIEKIVLDYLRKKGG